MWWQRCDASTTPNYTVSKCATVTMVAGKTQSIAFTTQVNRSNPLPDAPANLVLAIGGAQVWAGYTVGSTGKSANLGGANVYQLTTSGNGSNSPTRPGRCSTRLRRAAACWSVTPGRPISAARRTGARRRTTSERHCLRSPAADVPKSVEVNSRKSRHRSGFAASHHVHG